MIESIQIKNIATYDAVGIRINDLKKINFIYGANGSGKTTLTKFVDKPDAELFNSCTLNWKNNLPLTSLVYNKDFRDKNFGKGNIDGVFTLGQATKEVIELIEKKKIDLKKLKDEGSVKKVL